MFWASPPLCTTGPVDWEAAERRPGWLAVSQQADAGPSGGTPAAPGLVATVVRDEDLVKLALQDEGYTGSCVGTAYRVADEDAQQVLDDLDFREKGGYTREVVQVAHAGGTLDALLYRGTVDNPNFDASAIKDLDAAALTIKGAIGPSGPNRDYLLNLATWLREVGEEDAHVAALVDRIS